MSMLPAAERNECNLCPPHLEPTPKRVHIALEQESSDVLTRESSPEQFIYATKEGDREVWKDREQ